MARPVTTVVAARKSAVLEALRRLTRRAAPEKKITSARTKAGSPATSPRFTDSKKRSG